ncbi:CHAT domain-containing protein [Actinomadura fibrosa]|uniref:CHAT domain-containing protein n=1 Tax=Actinomadura fibrosa TaxID=111802 RepID=A0ABW2XGA5_9ACTN|nr:CHAT domain-containing protein [Actinomadura fibrosa]
MAEIDALLAELPEAEKGLRARLLLEEGVLRADLILRLHPDDHADRAPATAGSVAAAIDALAAGTAETVDGPGSGRTAGLLRLGVLHFVRFHAFDGPPGDLDRAAAALDEVADAPDATEPEEALAGLLLGNLLIARHLPRELRAGAGEGGGPGLNAMFPLFAGFTFDAAAGGSDVERAVELLERQASSAFWPPQLRATARVTARCGRILLGDLAQGIALLGDMLTDPDALAMLGGTAAEQDALRIWVAAEQAALDGRPDRLEPVLAEARRLLGHLDPGAPMAAPLAHLLGSRALTADAADAAVALLSRAYAETAADHPFHLLIQDLYSRAALQAALEDPGTAPDFAGVDAAVEPAERLLAETLERGADAPDLGRAELMSGIGLALRSIRAGAEADRRAALARLTEALGHLPEDDPVRPAGVAMAGALLAEAGIVHGALQNSAAGRAFLADAERLLQDRADDSPEALAMLGPAVVFIAQDAWERGDADALRTTLGQAASTLDRLPAGHRALPLMEAVAALVRLRLAQSTGDADELRAALDEFSAVAEGDGPGDEEPLREALAGLAACADIVRALLDGDTAQLESALERLTGTAGTVHFAATLRAPLLAALTLARLAGDPADLEAVLRLAREALDLMTPDSGTALAGDLLVAVAEALRAHGRSPAERAEAVGFGLRALRARAREVLLQVGAEDGIVRARAAGVLAQRIAAWALEDGRLDDAVAALELGRGQVRHAALSFGTIPDRLRSAGRPDLADRLAAHPPRPFAHVPALDEVIGAMTGGALAADLHREALDVLADRPETDRLLPPPALADLRAALDAAGADALVYLLSAPGTGWALLVPADEAAGPSAIRLRPLAEEALEPVRAFAAAHDVRRGDRPDDGAWHGAVGTVCDWAWPGLMEEVLAGCAGAAGGRIPRIVLAPTGMLGLVPWHAARYATDGGPRHLCQDAVVSYAASGRQLVAGAAARRPASAPRTVLVGDPDDSPGRDLRDAETEVLELRRAFYPGARVFGQVDVPDGERASVPAVRAALRTATRVHCASHAVALENPTDSAILLAPDGTGDGRLRVAGLLDPLEPGCPHCALLVLSSCESDLAAAHYDEALTLATAFLVAGVSEVIGSRWLVGDQATAVMMFVLHEEMAYGLPPADALNAAQQWMADPGRCVERLPPALRSLLAWQRAPLDSPGHWAAFTHQGLPAATAG